MDLADLHEQLGRIDGKLDMLLDSDLDRRVRSLEKSRSWLAGAIAVVSAALGYLTHGMKIT